MIRARQPLSRAQQGVWFAQELDRTSPSFTIAECIEIHGAVDRTLFEQALRQTVDEADALQVVFVRDEEGLAQVPRPPGDWSLAFADLGTADDPEGALQSRIAQEVEHVFDLAAGPLFAFSLFRLGPARYAWLQRYHHIALDGASVSLIVRRVAEVYGALAADHATGRPSFSSKDLILADEADYAASEALATDRDYWIGRYRDAPEPASLAGHYAPVGPTLRHHRFLGLATTEPLRGLAKSLDTSLPRLLIALAAAFVHRMTGQPDLVLGLALSGRASPALRASLGMMANVVPFRIALHAGTTLPALVREVHEEVRRCLAHQRYRGETIRRDVNQIRHHGAVTATTINIEPFSYDLRFGPHPIHTRNVANGPADDLNIFFFDRGAGKPIEVAFDANAALYTDAAVQTHLDHLQRFLDSVLAHPATPIGAQSFLSVEERRRLLSDWNETERAPPTALFPAWFERQAARMPDAEAVVYKSTSLSYEALNRRANRLAHHLIARKIGRGGLVGIAMPRSTDLVVALLATLKAGAAYLPLDPDYPTARLVHMIADAGPALILTTSEAHPRIAAATQHRVPALPLDTEETAALLEAQPSQDPDDASRAAPLSPEDTAYVIYTSGSTGLPKGILVRHAGLINLLAAMRASTRLGRGDSLLSVTTINFDIAGLELFLPLLDGARVVVAARDVILDPEALAARLRTSAATIVQGTPGLFRNLLMAGSDLGGLQVLVGGEALPAGLARDLVARGGRVRNVYGPAETTIWSTQWEVSGAFQTPPIGRPIWNTQLYVLDAALQPVPVGVPGELYIAGAGLARGYLSRPGLTASRFIACPFGPPGGRMYRTGDVVRWLEGGLVDYLRRADDQVKIRGFRIELGEIEAVLGRLPSVAQTSVLVCDDHHGDKQLVGYVVPEAGAEVDGAALRRALAERLPDYMVPAAILRLERLPLTPNGKLDRRALPAPDFTSASRRAASTPQEEVLCHLFEAVLGLPQVGPDDSFFDLGGHSLLAMRMIARIRQAFDTELSIRTLFEAPTPAGLAERLGPGGARRRPALQPQARPAVLPLSFAQRRLWLLAQIDGPGATYNMPFAVRLEGPLDAPALAQALRDLVARHESLRTRFAPDPAGGPVQQQVLPADDPRALPALTHQTSTPETLADDLAKASRHRFDLGSEGLIRTHLLALAPDRHVLLVLIHHAIADGWSLAPLARDLGTAYAARRLGQAPAWADLPVHYADYTLWQQDWLGQDSDPDSEGARQLGYWREALAGLPEQLDLPVDRPRPAVSSGRGGHVPVRIEAELHRQLRGLAQGRDASLFMVLQAGLAALLSRLGAGPDIPIGSPTAGRTDPALDDLIGFFVNTLVLRVDTGGNPSFADLLGRVRERALAAYEHQDLPFERLVEVLRPARSLARHPLFQVMLVLQNTAAVALALPGLAASPVSVDTATTKFDLTFSVEERFGPEGAPAGIAIDVEYACDLFEAATVADLGARLVRLLQVGVAAPDTPIGLLDILSAAERHRLLEAWNATVRPLPEASLPALFERQAARTPEATALVHAGERLSYGALNGRANRLARHLAALGIGPETRVALALPRSIEMVVGLLAILKAGAAYVPLDPNYPVERLRFMLADAAPRAVLTTAALRAELAPAAQVAVILPEDPALQAQLADLSAADLGDDARTSPLAPHHPAYVIYTSGSTGTPKGTSLTHRNAVNLIGWAHEAYTPVQLRNALFATSLNFDVAVFECLVPLLAGHTVHLVYNALALAAIEEEISVVNMVPSAFAAVIDAGPIPAGVRTINFGGETLKQDLVDRVFRETGVASVCNLYAPSETTTYSTWIELRRGEPLRGAIGRPIWNTQLYVLDAALQPVPVGVAGELYIAGAGLARGYLNRTGLTASRFIACPFGPPGQRMYRTGDVVRWQEGGTIEHLRRADDQVKIRGFRIEPGEVEAVLGRQASVAEACVVVRQDRNGDPQLVGYIVAKPGLATETAFLRRALAERLPDYMVPAAIVVLAAMPLTPSGKIDRRALPAPDFVASSRRTAAGPEEERLCALFAETLGLDRVGPDDSFFDLGGHSLLALRLIARIGQAFDADLSIRTLFEAPTPAGIAGRLKAAGGDALDAFRVLLPLRAGTDEAPLFCIHPAGGLGWPYYGLLPHIPGPRAVFALQARGLSEPGAAPGSLRAMAEDYVDVLLRAQPEGPYHLLGWSLGGHLAHAMATCLQAGGRTVATLILLDSFPAQRQATSEGESPGDRDRRHAAILEGVLARDGDATVAAALPGFDAIDAVHRARILESFRHAEDLIAGFEPDIFDGTITFLRATRHRPDLPARNPDDWRPSLRGTLDVHDVDSLHDDLLHPAALAQIGPVITRALSGPSATERENDEPIATRA